MKHLVFKYLTIPLTILVMFVGAYGFASSFISQIATHYGFDQLPFEVSELVSEPLLYAFYLISIYVFLLLMPIHFLIRKRISSDWTKLYIYLGMGALIAAVCLESIEPFIATDYFVYGQRQEYNKILEIIGYSTFNFAFYFILILGGIAFGVLNIIVTKIVGPKESHTRLESSNN